jgi:hypothetical protein
MAKKKATKKKEKVVVETTTTVEAPVIEPKVSMEDFTMIEKYQQGKAQTIAIRPYVTGAENMGLENYKMTLYEGVYHEEQLTCLDINGVRRYVTGLNEFAPDVKRLPRAEREAKVRQIRTAVAELEKELAQNVVSVDDPEFWNKVELLKPNNDKFWSKISLRAGNEPLFLDPKTDPYDLIKLFAIKAGGFSICAKDLADAKRKGPGCKFYLDELKETAGTRTQLVKLRNKAVAALQNLYDTNPTKLMYVAKIVDVSSSSYNHSTPNDIIYESMDLFIDGEGSERNFARAARLFIDTSKMETEDLKLKAIVKDANYYGIITSKSDGKIYTDDGVFIGRTQPDAIEYLKSPLNDEVLGYVMKKVEKYWNY